MEKAAIGPTIDEVREDGHRFVSGRKFNRPHVHTSILGLPRNGLATCQPTTQTVEPLHRSM